jgi:hypothetical protein
MCPYRLPHTATPDYESDGRSGIDERFIGGCAAAFAGEGEPPGLPAKRLLASKALEEGVGMRLWQSSCSRRIFHKAYRNASEHLPLRRSERLDTGRSDNPEWRPTRPFRKR